MQAWFCRAQTYLHFRPGLGEVALKRLAGHELAANRPDCLYLLLLHGIPGMQAQRGGLNAPILQSTPIRRLGARQTENQRSVQF